MRNPALTVKVFVVAAAGTVTDVGTVSNVPVRLIVTLAPPEGAALLRVTVHVALSPLPKLAAVHDNDCTLGRIEPGPVTTPPPAVVGTKYPSGDAPIWLMRRIGVETAPAPITRLMTATVPFGMTFWFRPETTQVNVPEFAAQSRFLPLLLAAVPAAAAIETTLSTG